MLFILFKKISLKQTAGRGHYSQKSTVLLHKCGHFNYFMWDLLLMCVLMIVHAKKSERESTKDYTSI